MIVQITPISIANIRWRTYMIFFVLNLCMALTVWLFYPETSGRTLEEIDYIFMGDCDKLFVIGKNGRILPGFRSMMKREDPEKTRGNNIINPAAHGPAVVQGHKEEVHHVEQLGDQK